MDDDKIDKNGYDDNDDFRDQILELCKLAQGNVTTIYWCKQQIKKRLKILDRLVNRLSKLKSLNTSNDDTSRIETVIKKQTDACKELGDKIQLEVESLDAIRIAAKSYGIDIKSRLLELDDTLANDDSFDEFFLD